MRHNCAVASKLAVPELPVVAVPLWTRQSLPIGVQIIAPPWKEALALRVAAYLETQGIVLAKGKASEATKRMRMSW